MLSRKIDWRIYGVADNVQFAEELLGAGVKVVQYRNKTETDEKFVENAKKIKELCKKNNATLIINDRYQLLKEIGADGVHVGLQDLHENDLEKIRAEVGGNVIIGLSVKTVENAVEGKNKGADYVCVSPLYDTVRKADEPGVGIEALREIAQAVGSDIPVLAIGGIREENLLMVVEAGAEGVALIGELERAAQKGELQEKVARMEKVFPSDDYREGKMKNMDKR